MKEKERKQWKNMNSEEKRNYWIKWDNRDKTGVNLERKKINNIRKTQEVKYVDEITNFIKDFLEIILYQYNKYRDDFKNDFNTQTTKLKKDIKDTVDKYTSLIIILILLYFLKDFLMWLLVKFDKLLKG